ncbi:inositol-trisphosphate 3-kinase A-like [Sinocyclocheilus rhinocerous]|uniref:inositol-trisphosphate 3-kinase A-like n=1 Tax=Sinocyclocheilus rhinocerous TaxID=307959 RepID=UPI0007B87FCD|nr:PREDICTED: inositol-trisphosphate 3-kinase A-like [Sinocyclocheilus rhinocerous]
MDKVKVYPDYQASGPSDRGGIAQSEPSRHLDAQTEAVFSHSSPVCDGPGRGGGGGGGGGGGRAGNFSSTEICDDQAQMAEQYSGQAGFLSDGNPGRGCLVPQVTITSDGDSREITEEDLEEEVNGRLRRKLSNSSISSNGSSTAFDESEDDILSDNETKSKGIVTLEHLGDSVDSGEQINAWWKLKTIVSCPLVTSQRRRLSWVQLAGHKGSFKAGDEGSILKKFSENEKLCFERLKEDALHSFVPSYYGVVERDGELFLKMKDLLAKFDLPNVMDCKMGRGETCKTDFKKTRSKEDVIQVFKDFVEGNKNITNSYITRLEDIKQALKASEFFKKHEVIGSSLLFIHNHTERAEVWLIDFGKTTPLPDGQNLDHYRPWEEGNREDGYLWGLDNLLQTLSSLARE